MVRNGLKQVLAGAAAVPQLRAVRAPLTRKRCGRTLGSPRRGLGLFLARFSPILGGYPPPGWGSCSAEWGGHGAEKRSLGRAPLGQANPRVLDQSQSRNRRREIFAPVTCLLVVACS